MKLLLTSGGITNTSINEALVTLLGKPIDESQRPVHPDCAVGTARVHTRVGVEVHRGEVDG